MTGDRSDVFAAALTSVYSRPRSSNTRLVDLIKRLVIRLREELRVLIECRHSNCPLRHWTSVELQLLLRGEGRESNPRCCHTVPGL